LPSLQREEGGTERGERKEREGGREVGEKKGQRMGGGRKLLTICLQAHHMYTKAVLRNGDLVKLHAVGFSSEVRMKPLSMMRCSLSNNAEGDGYEGGEGTLSVNSQH
jgi:hypothetical protein